MSASASDYTCEEALQAGCASFVSKPFKLTDLLEALGRQLDLKWRYHPQAVSPSRPAPDKSPPCDLEPKLPAQLLDLALKGDVMGITALIDSAVLEDTATGAFCAHLRELAGRYDVRGIRQALGSSASNG